MPFLELNFNRLQSNIYKNSRIEAIPQVGFTLSSDAKASLAGERCLISDTDHPLGVLSQIIHTRRFLI